MPGSFSSNRFCAESSEAGAMWNCMSGDSRPGRVRTQPNTTPAVRPRPRGIEEGASRRPALAVFHRHLVVAEAFLGAVVVVLVARKARRLGGVDEGIAQPVRLAHVGDVQQPALAAARVAFHLVVF